MTSSGQAALTVWARMVVVDEDFGLDCIGCSDQVECGSCSCQVVLYGLFWSGRRA